MSVQKKSKGKRLMIYFIAIIALVAIAVGGYILYGSNQMKKIPGLSAREALNYTLSQNQNGIITVGMIRQGESVWAVYGAQGLELTPELHTYEIGSLTKTCTAALVCRGVQEGQLTLDAPLDTYLELPTQAHYPTIRQLLTHTSGYRNFYFAPPMTGNFFHNRNDFYGIGDSMILERLAKTKTAPGPQDFVYSNFGYAALGLILEKVSQIEFTTLLNTYLREELGLAATHITSGGDLGNYWSWVPGDTYMAAGALTSNITDMLRYAQLLLTDGVCGGAVLDTLASVQATSSRNALLDIRMDEAAYGWMLDTENGFIWHNGGTGNYNCYLGLDPENHNAVVVLSNLSPSRHIPATVIGVKLLQEARCGGSFPWPAAGSPAESL